MSEKNLQFEIVKHFHNTYINQRGMLFEVNNSTDKGASRKGMGLVKGVSDLIYCAPGGRMVGFELKIDGSRHNVKHIREQYEWASDVFTNGGLAFFVFTVNEFDNIARYLINGTDHNRLRLACALNLKFIREILEVAEAKGLKTMKLYADEKA